MASNNQAQDWKSEVQSLFSTSSTLAGNSNAQDDAPVAVPRYYYVLHCVIWVDLGIDNAGRYQSRRSRSRAMISRFTGFRYNGMILFRASFYSVLMPYRRSMFRVLLSRRQFWSICSLITQFCLQWYVNIIFIRSTGSYAISNSISR